MTVIEAITLAQAGTGDNLAQSLSIVGSILTFIIAVATFAVFLSKYASMTINTKEKLEQYNLDHKEHMEQMRLEHEKDMGEIKLEQSKVDERLRKMGEDVAVLKDRTPGAA
jgi:uncharacterized membrane protein